MTQELSNEDKKEAKRDEGREDMLWKINVEVHDPDLGIVSLLFGLLQVSAGTLEAVIVAMCRW